MGEDLAIREQIARLVDQEQTVADLEDWLQEYAADLEDDPAKSLAADALRLLFEHGNSDWTDDELAERLGALSRVYWFRHAPKGVVISGSQAGLIHHDRRQAAAGRSPVAGSA